LTLRRMYIACAGHQPLFSELDTMPYVHHMRWSLAPARPHGLRSVARVLQCYYIHLSKPRIMPEDTNKNNTPWDRKNE
jgi:hypothetical protein